MSNSDLVPSSVPRVLIGEGAIAVRLDALAADITAFYQGKPLTVVAIMTGSILFAADLLRRIPLPLRLECLSVASYHGGTESSGAVQFLQDRLPRVEGRQVLLLDDILDTGLTLLAVQERLVKAGASGVRSAVLLQKQKARVQQVSADWVGFEIGDEFVVGYGLDYREEYRNLPFVGVLNR